MKHLQTFESYQMLNEEEIFGLFKSAKDKATKKAMDFLTKITKENPEIAKKLDSAASDVNLSEKDKKAIQAKSSQSPEKISDEIPPKVQAEIEASLEKVQERIESELILEKFDFKSVIGKILQWLGWGVEIVGFVKMAVAMMIAVGAGGVGAAAAFTGFAITSVIALVLIIAGFLISKKPWTVYMGIESQAQWQKKAEK